MILSTTLLSNFDISVNIGKTSLFYLKTELISTVLGFWTFVFNFRLETLFKRLFLFDNFCILLKKSSNFSFIYFCNICLRTISSYLAWDIFSIVSNFKDIRDIIAPGSIQYSGKNKIELFSIFSKTPYFFIYGRPRVIGVDPI